ncbi:MAG: hypothetical protein Q7V62_16295, partial [Actinomycetota bacterium]|nr:hypothetical protein [Actinomycetota bacterium]
AELGCSADRFNEARAPALYSTVGQAFAALVINREQFAYAAVQIEAGLRSLNVTEDDVIGVVRPLLRRFGRCASPYTDTICIADDCAYASPAEPGCVAQDILVAGADAKSEVTYYYMVLVAFTAFIVAVVIAVLIGMCMRMSHMYAPLGGKGKK